MRLLVSGVDAVRQVMLDISGFLNAKASVAWLSFQQIAGGKAKGEGVGYKVDIMQFNRLTSRTELHG